MNENVERVRGMYAAFKRGDIDALAEGVTDDVVWDVAGAPHVPPAGRRFGRAEVRKFFETVRDTMAFRTFEPREYIAEGDRVAATGSYSGTVKATGREFVAEWAMVFDMRGGKVARLREFTDTHALARAFDTGKSEFEGVPGV